MSQSANRQNGGYPYDQSPSNQYNLYHDGEVHMTAVTEQEVWSYLQRVTSSSVYNVALALGRPSGGYALRQRWL